MIELHVAYFDGKTSKARPAVAVCTEDRVTVHGERREPLAEAPLSQCRISEPLANTRRALRLPGGAMCEGDDGPEWLALEELLCAHRGLRLVHRLENHWKAVMISLVGVVACAAAVLYWGIPMAATWAAMALPASVDDSLGRQTLRSLDAGLLQPSALDPKRMETLQALFRDIVARETPGRPFQLELRRSPALGPNAFALPGHLILLTDELDKVAKSDAELGGVLAHELAHGKGRHALRTALQNTGVFLLASALLGDIGSLSTAVQALPTLLLRTGYSRAFEREADDAAGRYLLHTARTTKPLQELLGRLETKRPEFPAASLLSTHPGTDERIGRLRAIDAQGRASIKAR